MWHMPGHIYWKVQRYADSAWQQEASARVDHAHMMRDRVMPYQIHNYAHNNEWLTRSLNHVGRVRDAVAMAKNLIEQPQHPKKNHLKNKGGAAYYGRTRLIETLTRYELWDELIALADTPYLEPTEIADEQLRRLRVLGAAHFAKGQMEQGQEQIAAIEAMRDKAQEAQQKAIEEAEAKAREEKKSDEQVTKAKTDAEKQHKAKIEQFETALAELNGHLLLAEGDAKEALVRFEKVKDLSKEFLARVHLEAGDAAKAEQLAKQAVDAGKNQVQPLANYADILFRAGKTDQARKAFKQLRELSCYIDADLPVMRRLEPIAKDLDIDGDWRNPPSLPSDVGQRPALDTLGPYRWQPSAAPSWELPDSAGNLVSLQQYRGRPVVLIFYLGSGCLHCVEQLKKFAPMAADYEAAGITLLAVSTESVGDVSLSLSNFSESGEFPIRLLANQAMDVFRSYRAYDDFEDRPLHGTFVIDGQGLVRWQDISYEPFTDAKFVLEETQRLLRLP
jgi:peroxiredoxin/tetratricopeptide (TPR) repeat protein